MNFRRTALALAVTLWPMASVRAVDTVYLKREDKRVAGEITEVTKESVTVVPKIGDATTVPANEIERIEWDAEPPSLRLARSKKAAGQYESALDDYRKAQSEVSAGKEHLRADVEYGLAATIGQMALSDQAQQQEAITRLTAFKDSHRDHYRYYDALLLLGDVLLMMGDGNAAESTFNLVASSKSPDNQMAAKVRIARVKLARGDVAGARAAFDDVAAMPASTPAEQSRKFEAMLGQARCLQQQGDNDAAARILGEVIQDSAATDTRLQAEAYLRQGDAYAAAGQKTKEAVMAYLHVDVIPTLAREKDLHAEALYRLSQLWPALGQPARAEVAAGKLQTDYPNSEWARKLGEG